jgi:membrane protein implicated in regulation of membrane protease activity
MEQYMPIVWVVFAIFMLLCEGFTTQLVSIWFVLGITTIFTSDITIQSAVFLVVSLVSLIVTRPLVKRFKKRNKTTGTNADRHIGQVGFMLTDLTDIDKTAQAKVGAETWTVKSDKAPLLKGTKIKVLAIEGVKLIVEPISG